MPDFKFDGKFYFSILNDPKGKWPILVPRVSNPNFLDPNTFQITGPPGIAELLKGDLGITELIMTKVLDPVFKSVSTNTLFAEKIANQPPPLEQVNPNALNTPAGRVTGNDAVSKAKKMLMDSWIPKDSGLKSLEKTVITTMMESHKPLMDFLKVLIEMLGVGEDVVCRFLGTSIKVLGKQIGFPSRNPKYWDKSLGYAKTITFAKREFDEATAAALSEFQKSMSRTHPLKENIKGADTETDKQNGSDDREALYIGYFDEDGNEIDPPTWVKNSNKWISREVRDSNGNLVRIGAPFKRLSTNTRTGVEEIRLYHERALNRIRRQKQEMLETINQRAKDLEFEYKEKEKDIRSQKLPKGTLAEELKELSIRKENDVKSLEEEKRDATTEFDDLIQTILDVIDGTNVAGNNYVDDEDLSKGINPPAVLTEWMAKVRGSQLRQKYFPETVSTVQTLINRKGEPVEPYVFIPKNIVNYRGRNLPIEVPLAYSTQIRREEVRGENLFFNEVLQDKNPFIKYSLRNTVTNIDLNFNTSNDKPFEEDRITHFTQNESKAYLPDSLKSYYLPMEWEEVLEYEIRNKNTGQVIRTETEIIPHSIDVENDYELRVIEVINVPLLPPAGENNIPDIMAGSIVIIRENNKIQFIKTSGGSLEEITLLDVVKKNDVLAAASTSGSSTASTTSSMDSSTLNKFLSFFEKPVETKDINLTSNKFKTADRYAPRIIKGSYFYLRKENTGWGGEVGSRDSDDGEIFQVKDISENWLQIGISVTREDEYIIIDNNNKTIKILNYQINNLPKYVAEANRNNIKILNGLNIGKTIIINDFDIQSNIIYIKYEGDLINETIKSSWIIEYLESMTVETVQNFTYQEQFKAYIYPIEDINYIPVELSKPSPLVVQGFNKKSILTTLSERNRNEVDILRFKTPDLEVDGIFNSVSITNFTTEKGISVPTVQLKETIPSDYINRAYSNNINDKFYYPLRILGIPTINNTKNENNFIDPVTGTIFNFNNTIPEPLIQQEDGTSPLNNFHSTPDINEQNLLKEGIIFHGLDPRFIDRTKYKVFFLIEALKKDDRGIAPINKKFNPRDLEQVVDDGKLINQNRNSGGKGGKVWYGLLDKFTALPILVAKMVPLIASKLIPLIVKIIQLVSNPSKIKDLLLDLVLDKSISKFPINFPAFDKDQGALGKVIKLKNKGIKPPKTFDDPPTAPKNSMYYAGPQPKVKNPDIVSMMDGQALAEFGKGAFKKPLFSFGVDVKFGNTSKPFKTISKKKKRVDFNKAPETRDQPMIELILNFIKMPFEIIFMIFKWIMKWVKKLLNPTKIPAAITEFITFKWLKDIIGKNSLFQILGIVDPNTDGRLKAGLDQIKTANGDNAQAILDRLINNLGKGSDDIIEVLVYNVFRNGNFVRQETVERPFNGDINDSNLNKKGDSGTINPNNNVSSDFGNSGNGNSNRGKFDPLAFCGPRNFSINGLLPIPFLSAMPNFNICEMPQIFLKPLEMILGILKIIQELLNALINMPMAILGLDPQIPIPKFGKEIPFANTFENTLEQIKSRMIQVRPKGKK